MIKKLPIIGLIILLTIAAVGAYLLIASGHQKIVYVDMNQLYNDFEMKKEGEISFNLIRQNKESIIDSLRVDLEADFRKNGNKENDFINSKRNYLMYRQKTDADELQQMAQELDKKIFKRLSEYVKNFGEEKGYDLVLGATGDGSIMYANNKIDITAEVKEYVNHKYLGK